MNNYLTATYKNVLVAKHTIHSEKMAVYQRDIIGIVKHQGI